MTEQDKGGKPDAQPTLTPDVQEMVSAAKEQGVSLREYIRRTAQSVIDTEATKVRGELQQTVSAVTERQQAIQQAGAEFDAWVEDLKAQGVDLEGKDLVSMKNKHIAQRIPATPPKEEIPQGQPLPQGQQQNPLMVSALQLAAEQGLVRGDPEMNGLDYTSWSTLFSSIVNAGEKKRQRLTAPAQFQDDAETPGGGPVIPGEIGGGRGSAPSDNPIENINDPDELLGRVDWDKLNLPPG